MISFRTRPAHADDWDSVAFDGDNEELLGHLFHQFLANSGWEFTEDDDWSDPDE
tara:strand:+ start:1409 stop:1570 length:162 start_codon:yes stop_codon:yes gene_type:complete